MYNVIYNISIIEVYIYEKKNAKKLALSISLSSRFYKKSGKCDWSARCKTGKAEHRQ